MNHRIWYRFSDIACWLEGTEASPADLLKRTKDYVLDHEEEAFMAPTKLAGADLIEAFRLLTELVEDRLPEKDLERLVDLMDASGAFGARARQRRQKPKRFVDAVSLQFIGY